MSAAVAEPEPTSGSVEAFADSDDIWYSGAPDDELPAAELVSEEPVGVAAASERSETFVWIPAEEERG